MYKKFIAFSALIAFGIGITANGQDLTPVEQEKITSAKSVHLNNKEGIGSVFHVSIPEGGVLTVTSNGNDAISKAISGNGTYVTSDVAGNTAFFTFHKVGHYAVGAVTRCGLSFSVVADVYKNDDTKRKLQDSKPKVVIDAPANCGQKDNASK